MLEASCHSTNFVKNVAVVTFVNAYNHNVWCEGILLAILTCEKL
jgi:hypothetical protein